MCKGSSAVGGEGLFFTGFLFFNNPFASFLGTSPYIGGGFFIQFCFNETAASLFFTDILFCNNLLLFYHKLNEQNTENEKKQ